VSIPPCPLITTPAGASGDVTRLPPPETCHPDSAGGVTVTVIVSSASVPLNSTGVLTVKPDDLNATT